MPFPTTSVLDNFDRANGDLGSNWTGPIANGADDTTISSNQVTGATANICTDGWNPSTVGPDCEAHIGVPTRSGQVGLYLGLSALTSSPNGYYARTDDVGNWIIWRIDSGSFVQLGSTVADYNSYTAIGFERIGSTLKLYRLTSGSWVEVMSRTDATYTAAGYIGFRVSNTTIRVNDFGGGTITTDQSISGAGAIASPSAVGSPTVTPGEVSISPSAIASPSGVGSPTITPDAVTVSPSAIASPSAVGEPAITVGAVDILPSGIATPSAVGSPVVTADGGDQNIVDAGGIAPLSAVGSPTVAPGEVSIVPTGITSPAGVGAPVVTVGDVTLSPTGVVSVAGVGTPVVTAGDVTISPTGISRTPAVGTPVVTLTPVTISPTGVSSAAAVGNPVVTMPGLPPTTVRTVSANLATLQAQPNRTPTAMAIIRKTRLEFEPWGVAQTPFHMQGLLYGDAPMWNGRSFMMADHVVFHDQIVSAISYNGQTYTRLVTDPTDISQWANWVLLAGAPGASGTRPALYAGDSSVYLFLRSGTSVVRYWSDDGGVWVGPATIASSSFYGASANEVGIAPVSPGQCYSAVGIPSGNDIGVRVCAFWPDRSLTAWGPTADSLELIQPHHSRTLTMIDAVRTSDGSDLVVYPGSQGDLAMISRVRNGRFYPPRPLFPADLVDDWNHVKVYAMDYIGSTLWISGRITRYGSTSESPVAWDFMTRSYSDGEHWSVDPNMYICEPEIRSKMLLVGDWVYYPGLYTIYRAKATWLIDQLYDRPGTYHYVRPDDIASMSIEVPQADGSPGSLSLETVSGRGALYWPGTPSNRWTWNDGHVWR